MAGNDSHVVPIMPEDHWDFDNDCILSISLCGEEYKEKVLEGKSRKFRLSQIHNANLGVDLGPHDEDMGFGWTVSQSSILHRYLSEGSYNLSRIKRIEPELQNKVMLDLHDRSIVLMVLHEIGIAKPVHFLHCKKPLNCKMSIRTLEIATKKYRNQHLIYNGHDGPLSEAPAMLLNSYNIKLTRANAIINDYYLCYYRLLHNHPFDWSFDEVILDFNHAVIMTTEGKDRSK